VTTAAGDGGPAQVPGNAPLLAFDSTYGGLVIRVGPCVLARAPYSPSVATAAPCVTTAPGRGSCTWTRRGWPHG